MAHPTKNERSIVDFVVVVVASSVRAISATFRNYLKKKLAINFIEAHKCSDKIKSKTASSGLAKRTDEADKKND